MVSFKLEHEFLEIPLQKFIAHLNDEKLNQMLLVGLDFTERKLLKHKEFPDRIEWQFLLKKSGDLPKVISKILKSNSISWLEDSVFKKNENCIYWHISSKDSLLKFSGEGTWKLSSFKKGSKRVIEGNI